MTGSLLLVYAVRVAELPAVTGVVGCGNVIVFVSSGIAVPLKPTDWLVFATFSVLSFVTVDPLVVPTSWGAKLIKSVQDAPAASVPALDWVVSCGQVELPPIVKPEEMAGLSPLPGTSKVSAELPMLVIVSVCGLSALTLSTYVVANAKGAAVVVTFRIRWLPESVTYMSPALSSVSAWSPFNSALVAAPSSPLNPPVPLPATVVMFPVATITSRTRLLPASAM